MSTTSRVKDFVRTHPRLYDNLKGLKRRLITDPDPAYDFFDAYSRTHGGQVNFIQIGANDGLRNDPFREFIVRDHWNGILVEPLPWAFELLKKNYAYCSRQLVFVNAAVSHSESQSLTFYGFDESFLRGLPLEKQLDYLRKASFDKEHVEHYVDSSERWGIRETQVRCVTLPSLLKQHWRGAKIDLLMIDAEGHEPSIIRSIDFSEFHPEVIFFESHTLGVERAALSQLLNSNGYKVFDILGDSVAMAPETAHRLGYEHRSNT